jgi:cyanate lyase
VIIIHGGGALPSLIHDKNDVSILDASAMLQSKVIKKDKIQFIEEADLSSKANGDIILIPTEAGIDSFIYWDGLAYQLYEIIDVP